jgi:hypothetical protein
MLVQPLLPLVFLHHIIIIITEPSQWCSEPPCSSPVIVSALLLSAHSLPSPLPSPQQHPHLLQMTNLVVRRTSRLHFVSSRRLSVISSTYAPIAHCFLDQAILGLQTPDGKVLRSHGYVVVAAARASMFAVKYVLDTYVPAAFDQFAQVGGGHFFLFLSSFLSFFLFLLLFLIGLLGSSHQSGIDSFQTNTV